MRMRNLKTKIPLLSIPYVSLLYILFFKLVLITSLNSSKIKYLDTILIKIKTIYIIFSDRKFSVHLTLVILEV